MSNAKESKSVRTTKAKPAPAQGGPPEVAIDAATTVALPNPADAPAPLKAAGRTKKPAPSVARRDAATPAVEISDWAKRAAAKGSMTDQMAAVPETVAATEPPPEASTPKKGRAAKAVRPPRPAPKPTPAAEPGSLRAIGSAWIDALCAAGHSKSTVSSYANDLEVAYEHLGADTSAGTISEKEIERFNVSKGVMRKANGKPKAMPTILKTRRALRLALVWAAQKGLISKAPFPAKTSA